MPTYHVRTGKDAAGNIQLYGNGSGDSFENAWAGFEGHRQSNKVEEGATVVVYGEIVPASNRPVESPQFWNNGVTLKGGDAAAKLKSPYVLKDFWGHDEITICDLALEKVGFRGWEWQNVHHSFKQYDPAQRSKNVTIRNVVAALPGNAAIAWELNQGNDNWTFINCDISGTYAGIIYTKKAQGTSETAGPKNVRVIQCKLHDTNPDQVLSDGHAIGGQPVDGFELGYCEIFNTNGTAVEFYQTERIQKNVCIHHNAITNAKRISDSTTLGRGISFTGDNSTQAIGKRTGNRIEFNEVSETDGAAVAVNQLDPVICTNNILHEPRGYKGGRYACFESLQRNNAVNLQIPHGNRMIKKTASFLATSIKFGESGTFDADELNQIEIPQNA